MIGDEDRSRGQGASVVGSGPIVHRMPPYLRWLVPVVLVFALAGMVVSLRAGLSGWVIVVWGLLVLLGVVALLDVHITRVELGPEGLTIVTGFRRRDVPREEIESVTWGKGVGASLKLMDGRWIGLPEVGPGSQGLASSVRAWLRRA